MMLRVFLLASLLVAAFADHHEDDHHDDDHHGCCSHEDRIEIQHLWQSVWESSFTERKLQIGKAIFEESVTQLSVIIIIIIIIIILSSLSHLQSFRSFVY